MKPEEQLQKALVDSIVSFRTPNTTARGEN